MKHLLERSGGFIPSLVALTLPLVSIPIASDSYILPRASIVIAGACLGIGLALLIPAGPSLGALRFPLVAAAGAAVLAFVFSISWPLSLIGSFTRYESLPMRLSYLGLAASAMWLLRTKGQRDAVGVAFVVGTSVVAFKAWLQWFFHAPFRPDGDVGNANLLAALIVMAIPIAIDRGRRSAYLTPAWAVAIVVLLAGLVVTTSRSGGLGLIAGTLTVIVLSVPARFIRAAGAFALVGVGAAAAFILVSPPLRGLNNDPPELRAHLYQDALRMIAARPVTGWGEDTTGLAFGQFLSQDYAGLVTFDRVHSGVLEIAATQGLLGLAALTWVAVVLAREVWRGTSQPGIPGLVGALVGYSVWVLFNFDWAPATGAFWLLAGTLWSVLQAQLLPIHGAVAPHPARSLRDGATFPSESGRERAGGAAPGRMVGSVWQPALAVILAVAAVVLAVFPVLADVWYLKGRADLSVRVDPLQAQYHWALGTVPELQRAADLGETDPAMYIALGDGYAKLGQRDQAARAYRRALEIDPFYSPAAQRLKALGA
ncbi:MAG TPA: O-antigen ligase family protein [Candidatus Dormibacteraeota bacterium]|nr:O-antigen ligase family protein [Candidatus Dormibacteraeota bacterium]